MLNDLQVIQREIDRYNAKYKLLDKNPPMTFQIEDNKIWLKTVNITDVKVVNKTLTIEIPQFVDAINFKGLFKVDFDISSVPNWSTNREKYEKQCMKLFFGNIVLVIVGNNKTLYGRFDGIGYVKTTGDDYEDTEPLGLSKIVFKHFDARGFSDLVFGIHKSSFPNLHGIDISDMLLDKVNAVDDFSLVYKGSPDYDWQKVNFSGLQSAYKMFEGTSVRTVDIEQKFKQLRPKLQMKQMFSGCGSIQRIPNIGIQECKETTRMFESTSLSSDLVIKDCKITQDLISCESMFSNTRIKRLVVDNLVFNTCENNAAGFESMFNGCKYLQEVVIQNIQCENNPKSISKQRGCQVWLNSMFSYCRLLKKVEFRNINLENCIIEMTQMFLGCEELESIEFHNVTVKQIDVLYKQFEGCKNLRKLVLDNVKVLQPVELKDEKYVVRDNSIKRELNNLFSMTPLAGQAVSKEYTRLICSNIDD